MGIEIEYPLEYASSGDSLFRDTGVGLSFDTHASVGVKGISASVGHRLAVQTPVFDFSVSLFSVLCFSVDDQ